MTRAAKCSGSRWGSARVAGPMLRQMNEDSRRRFNGSERSGGKRRNNDSGVRRRPDACHGQAACKGAAAGKIVVFRRATVDRCGVFPACNAKRVAENITGNGGAACAKRERADDRLQNEKERCGKRYSELTPWWIPEQISVPFPATFPRMARGMGNVEVPFSIAPGRAVRNSRLCTVFSSPQFQ